MTEQEIEQFYNHYKNSISAIDNAEIRLLKCSYSFDKWAESLNEKSKLIRRLYEENEIMIKKLLNLRAGELDGSTADKLITHVDFFVSEGFRDYQAVAAVLDILIDYYKTNGPVERIFDCYYFMASELIEVNEYVSACEYYRRALELYENPMDCKEDYRRFRIMCCYYFRLVAAVCDKNASQNTVVAYFKSAMNIWVDNPIVEFLTPKKLDAIESTLCTLLCIAADKYLTYDIGLFPEFLEMVEHEYNIQARKYGDILQVSTEIYIIYHKLRKYNGFITKGEYNNFICRKYNYETGKHREFTYGNKDFITVFDDEVADEDFDIGDICYMNESYMFVNNLIPEMIEIFRKNDFVKDIERYYMDFPVVSGNYLIDYMIEANVKRILKYSRDENEVINLIEKVFINRQVVTLIHSNMVSKLAVTITDRLITKAPEIFIGHFGFRTAAAVKKGRKILLNYVSNAGKMHDIGKIMCADIVNLQSRRISDKEFAIIKTHPRKAEDIIKNIPAISQYSDIAVGHHKSYDGRTGYPEDFDNSKSPYRIFIDIIKICDCIDAATDFLGRNYTDSKDFATVLEELKAGKGTVYSDVIVDYMENDRDIIENVERITREERRHTYYEIYHNMVAPVVSYQEDDETFVRQYVPDDSMQIAAITGRSSREQEEFISNYDNNAYVIVDGRNKVFGYICLNNNGDTLEIVEIYMAKRNRRNGIGSKLLAYAEGMARKQGFLYINMAEIKQGHYDIFCWRNGYVKSSRKGIMVKKL